MASEEAVYEIIIDPAANDHMAEHYEFLAQVSESAARRLLMRLHRDIQSLQTMPFRNPVFNSLYVSPLKYRYLMSNERYRIIYQIVETTVFVDDIQDCRQDDWIEDELELADAVANDDGNRYSLDEVRTKLGDDLS